MKTKFLSLTDVLKTGRPFRRMHEKAWRVSGSAFSVTQEDIEATDWEFKPELLRLKIYISPDRTQVTLSHDAPLNWDLVHMIEEES